MDNLIRNILTARVYDVAERTALDFMPRLSKHLNTNIWIKREDTQPVFSFKIRGAYNCIYQLNTEARRKGVICVSAGNHAQGVALSGQALGIDTTIVMPITAPALKVQACQARGANVVLYGDNFDDASEYALRLAGESGKTFIHPFNDWDVIAGQGTIGKEMIEQQPDLDAVFVPVGGGGLIAGVASYIKFIAPHCKVIGVEPIESASMKEALLKNERIKLKQVGTFADGTAVKQIGENPFEIAKALVDDIICVTTDEICAAMKDIFEDTRAITEPSGALGVAGIKKYLAENPECKFKNIGNVLSGANINFDRLQYVAERTELGEGKEALLAVTILEEPGSFLNFVNVIGQRHITEFNYRYSSDRQAIVYVGIHLQHGKTEKEEVIKALESHKLAVTDLSDNELAKLHIRHMVGGKKPRTIKHERLLRIIFPQQPNALFKFLTTLNIQLNITLFHYRNHGSDYGRALVGINVPPENEEFFQEFLSKLGYDYIEETDNPAYELFL
ncbi:threonine ammonia-lyase, biosynthetic [Wohlfahrtiimonas larvae]|uniref:L-threonine dehydratase n=1 Tax=Wohlfahrtiimonas larvae TaxID=1157986 RepID=A0ABP9MB15_9GAMM|nr:threonine ammonia-lyase, biosynthetic [Wohlfahrtiimonas larvae]